MKKNLNDYFPTRKPRSKTLENELDISKQQKPKKPKNKSKRIIELEQKVVSLDNLPQVNQEKKKEDLIKKHFKDLDWEWVTEEEGRCLCNTCGKTFALNQKSHGDQHLVTTLHVQSASKKMKQVPLFAFLKSHEEQQVKLLLFIIHSDNAFETFCGEDAKEFLPVHFPGHISSNRDYLLKYLDLVFLHVDKQVDCLLKNNTEGISLIPDECTDDAENTVVNVMGIVGGKSVLLTTEFLEGAPNGNEIFACLNICLQKFRVDVKQVHAVQRDSTAYMELGVSKFIEGNKLKARSVPCSSHLLDSHVKSICNYGVIGTLLSKVRCAFTSQSKKVARSWEDFKEKKKIFLRSVPHYKSTRAFLTDCDLLEFLQEEIQFEDETSTPVLQLMETWLFSCTKLKAKEASVDKLSSFLDEHNALNLVILIRVLLSLVRPIVLKIKSFQALSYATLHTVEPTWTSLIRSFHKIKDFPDDIKNIYKDNKQVMRKHKTPLLNLLCEVSKSMQSQWDKHYEPCSDLLSAASALDPRSKPALNYETFFESIPFDVEDFAKEYKNYKLFCDNFTVDEGNDNSDVFDLRSFWREHAKFFPVLSAAALRILSIPSSNAEVERSFSSHNRLVTPDRIALSTEKIKKIMFIKKNYRLFK